MAIELQPITIDDRDIIIQFYQGLSDQPIASEKLEQYWQFIVGLLSNPEVLCIKAVKDGTIIGYLIVAIMVVPLDGAMGYGLQFYTLPQYRNTKAGYLLYNYGIDWLKARGIKNIYVQTEEKSELYEKLGFKVNRLVYGKILGD